MKKRIAILSLAALVLGIAGCGGDGDNGMNPIGEQFVAIRNNSLVRGDVNNTNRTTSTPISGVPNGVDLIGLDYRPANGDLIALGSNNRLYTLNAGTATATAIGADAFSPTVTGTQVGFDFNPTVDRIRLVGNDGQNLRLNPNTGAVAATDTQLSDAGADIVAAAYTDNLAGATVTTLYVIDASTNFLMRQGGLNGDPSPNGGQLSPVGPLGFDVTGDDSFDIDSNGDAFLAAGNTLYRVNLATGAATRLGNFNGGAVDALTIVP